MKTEVLKPTKDAIEKAASLIRRGELVAFPTETVYGLGADATDPAAAAAIYAAKGRASDNPLIVHIAFPEDAENFAYTSPLYYELAERFMPGPLTVILPKKNIIPHEVTGCLDTVAVRCPSNEIAHSLIETSGLPIAAPSANRSGAPSPTNAEDVYSDMDGRIPLILDGGASAIGVESTVIKLDGRSATILRPGAVTAHMLSQICDSVTVAKAVIDPSSVGDAPLSPGMKYKHYAPKAELYLLDGSASMAAEYVMRHKDDRTAVICSDSDSALFGGTILLLTGASGDYQEYEHRLFSLLRRADELNASTIYALLPPLDDNYLAIYNRIIRAAGSKIVKL